MKIKGNTVGTTMPRANLNQTDHKKADYVIGREMVEEMIHVDYTKPTEPIDPNTKLWIDLNDEADVAVLCSPQELTDEQKAQAKANLGLEEGATMRRGTDPVPSLADDTPDFWRNLGTGAWEITGAGQANIVNGSTFFMGTILNMPASNYVFQVVFTPIAQTAYFRTAASGNTWNSTWKTLVPTKQELVQSVLDALPTWEGGAY